LVDRFRKTKSSKIGPKMTKKGPPKSGLGDRQVGAFSVFWPRDTGIPFIFWAFFDFFQKIARLRG